MSAWSTTERKRKKITGVLFQPVSLYFFLPFFQFEKTKQNKKILKWTEGGAYGCDSERRRGPWVTWLRLVVVMVGEVGVEGGPALPLFTHCCCCSPGLYTECPRRCSLCRGAEHRICPHTSRCLACGHEMACTVGKATGCSFNGSMGKWLKG